MIEQLVKRYQKAMLSREEKWLANSSDLVELERRQRELQRGNAPWQNAQLTNPNLRGHV
jgi:hypothetical protein